ncbi:hypothetical protein [Frigidibacter sp.]|uniref:hypothetical protein n=1 Tax=Frigidibacter sp. TaxID=2586418 RepID=UPI002736174A|nr:hypothetical protein [Frigidibacter sp.]MDP3342293.1 hypothetical protein [Frigidibacter sp.]
MPNNAFTFVVSLAALPLLGGAVLLLANALWHTATAPTTPKWQTFLWFSAVGYALFRLPEFGAALSSGW